MLSGIAGLVVIFSNTAVVEHDAPQAKMVDHVQVVTRHHHRDADIIEPPEEAHDLEREVGIQVAGRLVGDQDGGLLIDGTRDADALLFAGRQFQAARHVSLPSSPTWSSAARTRLPILGGARRQ